MNVLELKTHRALTRETHRQECEAVTVHVNQLIFTAVTVCIRSFAKHGFHCRIFDSEFIYCFENMLMVLAE